MASLCKLDYPLYACQVLDGDHVVVGGGGGAAKTGVPNVVDVLMMQKVSGKLQADPCERLDTGDYSVMNMSVVNRSSENSFLLAIGLGGTCKLYSVRRTSKSNESGTDHNVRKRKPNKELKETHSNGVHSFEFNLLQTLETDFSPDEPLQKAVRISKDCKILITGGSDGHVRAWNIHDFSKRFFVKGHKDDVTDVDISPDGKDVVSVSRDGTAIILDSETGCKKLDLHVKWNSQMTTRNYRFRSCRYGVVVDDQKSYALFTAHAPIRPGRRADTKAPQGCITKWARKKASVGPLCPAIVQYTGREAISSMTISSDGVFLGLGFMEGSVAIYISFSLQCAKRVSNYHSIFVTGLSFLPPSDNAITGPCDAAVVSVSADNQCKVLKLSKRTLFPVWIGLLLVIVSVLAAAYILFELGII